MHNQVVDLIIKARWIAPVFPEKQLFNNYALAINNGQIVALDSQNTIDQQYQGQQVVDLDNHLLTPGLINAHGHLAMSLLRGFADDLPLMTWLENHIWPAEGKWVDENFVSDGTEFAIAEMLLSGTSCFSDMYFFPDTCARVARKLGMRAQVCFPIMDFPTAWEVDLRITLARD